LPEFERSDGKPRRSEKQHDPTTEERDERVTLHPRKAEDVLRKLLRTPPKREKD
jgi:hypothetical protein